MVALNYKPFLQGRAVTAYNFRLLYLLQVYVLTGDINFQEQAGRFHHIHYFRLRLLHDLCLLLGAIEYVCQCQRNDALLVVKKESEHRAKLPRYLPLQIMLPSIFHVYAHRPIWL